MAADGEIITKDFDTRHHFISVISRVFANTPESDLRLRVQVIAWTSGNKLASLFYLREFKQLIHDYPDFAYMMLESQLTKSRRSQSPEGSGSHDA